MASITLRLVKGSPLTNAETDNNFTELNTEKVERNGTIPMSGKLTLVASNTDRASVVIPNGAAPTSPSTGDLWAESGTPKYRSTAATKTFAFVEDGVIGYTGSRGATGFTGSVGTTGGTGFTGSKGTVGFTGSAGPVSGSANQVVYKDGGNTPAGSVNFTTNGNGVAVGPISPSATVGRIDASNDVVSSSSSDERFKKDINSIVDALVKVSCLRAVHFKWDGATKIHHGYEDGLDDIGIIAQDVRDVLPEIVTTREDGYLAVRYERLIPLLVAAVQELSAKVERLEAE